MKCLRDAWHCAKCSACYHYVWGQYYFSLHFIEAATRFSGQGQLKSIKVTWQQTQDANSTLSGFKAMLPQLNHTPSYIQKETTTKKSITYYETDTSL